MHHVRIGGPATGPHGGQEHAGAPNGKGGPANHPGYEKRVCACFMCICVLVCVCVCVRVRVCVCVCARQARQEQRAEGRKVFAVLPRSAARPPLTPRPACQDQRYASGAILPQLLLLQAGGVLLLRLLLLLLLLQAKNSGMLVE